MLVEADFIIVLVGVLILSSAFFGRNREHQSQYSPQTMVCVKGIFSIMIVLFHLSQHINGGPLFKIIGDTGYLSVAVFFFISGYGMYTRILQTGGGIAKALFLTEFQAL